MSKFINGLVGFVVGATAGIVTGLLVAPRKGAETRKLVKDKATKASKEITDQVEDKIDKMQEKFRSFKEKAAEEVEEVKDSISASKKSDPKDSSKQK